MFNLKNHGSLGLRKAAALAGVNIKNARYEPLDHTRRNDELVARIEEDGEITEITMSDVEYASQYSWREINNRK